MSVLIVVSVDGHFVLISNQISVELVEGVRLVKGWCFRAIIDSESTLLRVELSEQFLQVVDGDALLLAQTK